MDREAWKEYAILIVGILLTPFLLGVYCGAVMLAYRWVTR